jgi:hypothetical protein
MLSVVERQARFGVVYTRALAAQAGFGFDETSSGEDVLAVDGTLHFPEGDIRIQVKTTHTMTNLALGQNIKFRAETRWIENWEKSRLPVYLVYVLVPKDSDKWVSHQDVNTVMPGTHAYWHLLNGHLFENSKTLQIPRSNRLKHETIKAWHNDFLRDFGVAR